MAMGDLTAKVRAKFSRHSADDRDEQPQASQASNDQHQRRRHTWTFRSRGNGNQRRRDVRGLVGGDNAGADAGDGNGNGNNEGNANPFPNARPSAEGFPFDPPGDDALGQAAQAAGGRREFAASVGEFPTTSLELHADGVHHDTQTHSQPDLHHQSGNHNNQDQGHNQDQDNNEDEDYDEAADLARSPLRRQSILSDQNAGLVRSLLNIPTPTPSPRDTIAPPQVSDAMGNRKVWVKRAGGSATLVAILADYLVDDVREMILKKYANTLGRNYDAPDVTLRVVPRENRQERTLGPEEVMCEVLDDNFPGGQTVEEALVIDVPLRRTPRPSPQPVARYYPEEERRPPEAASDYFPQMPVSNVPSPGAHSISVLTTGHVPNLPSPGSGRRSHHRDRPRLGRQHTSSPTMNGQSSLPPQHSDKSMATPAPTAPPLPSPPAPPQSGMTQIQQAAPPPRISSPRPQTRPKRNRKIGGDHPSFSTGILNGNVPPINVLIVEDNIINLKLLEAFMKRLKVRSQNAMNGREAVTKWRAGGFHLVLMDIQLPIMSGLDATKEIRRLERLNSIGVFTSSAGSSAPPELDHTEPEGDDKLHNTNLFKSPVIIVALTASSLQSDRHEALAAGCNDFLTKPVNFVWLERKVMEWGCMQALIDYRGWRQWKDYSQNSRDDEGKDGKGKGTSAAGGKKKKNRAPSATSSPSASTSQTPMRESPGLVGLGLGVDSGESSHSLQTPENGDR